MKASRPLVNVCIAALFLLVFVGCYRYFLYFYFRYSGFELRSHDPIFFGLSAAIAILPAIGLTGRATPAAVVSIFVFVLLYIPSIVMFAFASDLSTGEILLVESVLMVSMLMIIASDWVLIENPLSLTLNVDLAHVVLVLTAVSTAYVAIVYRSNLHLVSFGDALYEQRSANAELGGGLVTRYLSSWLNAVFVPICLARGLTRRSLVYFGTGTLACIVLYMATAAKIAILLPGVFAAFYAVFANGRLRRIYPIFVVSLSAVLVFLIFAARWNDLWFLASSIVTNRTIGSGGQLTMAYYDFFRSHPQTLYTHVNLINGLVGGYPYGDLDLGHVVGAYYWSVTNNANANFWATDGFAAMGLAGIAIVTVACASVLLAFNAVTKNFDKMFVALCLLPFIVSLLNSSLFSSMWSGGGGMLGAFFLLQGGSETRVRSTHGLELTPDMA